MRNRTAMLKMEKWTEKDTPRIVDGKQTQWPIVPGGRTLAKPKKGEKKK